MLKALPVNLTVDFWCGSLVGLNLLNHVSQDCSYHGTYRKYLYNTPKVKGQGYWPAGGFSDPGTRDHFLCTPWKCATMLQLSSWKFSLKLASHRILNHLLESSRTSEVKDLPGIFQILTRWLIVNLQ